MRRVLAIVGATVVLVGAAFFALSEQWPWRRITTVTPTPLHIVVPPLIRTASDTLRRGESLGDLFSRHGIGAVELLELVGLLELDARRTRAGQVFRFGYEGTDSTAHAVIIRRSADLELRAMRGSERWTAERRAIQWDTQLVRLEGRIETSLYDAITVALASEPLTTAERIRLAWDLADVFAWQVDFSSDLRPGDEFALLFERQLSEDGDVRVGRVFAGEIHVNGRRLEAYRFATAEGREEYFDGKGESLRRAFLRAPVEFRRIASGFSRSRRHPILGVWRRHQGIDFAADPGTPVRASGDGQVMFAGWSGGYGRMIELRHKNGVTTRYAHLSRFGQGARVGARVLQGEIIGYVGATGLASGPHLHYEFRQGGVAVDPRRVATGAGDPVPAGLLHAFSTERDRLSRLLRPVASTIQVADGSD